MAVLLRQAWSKSQWTVFKWDTLLSQQMLDAIKHQIWQFFFFQEDSAQVHCACNTVQLSEKCNLSVFPFCQVVQKRKLFDVA